MRIIEFVFKSATSAEHVKFGVAPDFVEPVLDGVLFLVDKVDGTKATVNGGEVLYYNVYDERE